MSEEEIFNIGKTPCKKLAPFVQQLGFDGARSAFSTTEKRMKGIVLIQFPKSKADSSSYKIHQDSTWKQFGFFGVITTDNNGNVYTSPIPMVNTLDVPISEMNKVYKVDALTGKMSLFIDLPKATFTNDAVPYGVLGNYFDCHGNKLYISSVAGSSRDNEVGHIYVIDVISGKIIDEINNVDAMGLFVAGVTGKKMLYFGNARNSNVQCVELKKDGSFANKKITTAFSLDALGPRGNDRAKKIRFDKYGNLYVHGLDFAFNLAAQTEKPETIYQFSYDDIEEKWAFVKIIH